MSSEILSIEKISFKTKSQEILNKVSFQVEEGERVVLTGPSGSGKSSLLKIIASFLTPTEGKILYKNQNIESIEATEYRKSVSYFFQNAQLFDQTVRDNLAFPYLIREKDFDEEKAKSYLEYVKLPGTYMHKSINDLSGGEKQRVALVRNLLFEPEVLLLDEATSSLDQKNSKIILDMLDRLNKERNRTIIMVTHDSEQIQQADRLIRLVDGQMEGSE